MREDIPRLSAEFVSSLISNRNANVQNEENTKYKDELLNKRMWLTLDIERLEEQNNEEQSSEVELQIVELKEKLKNVECELDDLGVVTLTQEQVEEMFEEIGKSSEINLRDSVPIGTMNTEYTTEAPKTISIADGNCTYICITATVKSSKSNMFSTNFIPMNEDKVEKYKNSIAEVFISKAIGLSIGAWFKYSDYLPWELLASPPESHYETTASYTITAAHATNVKFIFCYSPALNTYSLGLILHSTSCRDVHVNNYIYDGVIKGTTRENAYILECPNYNNVESITRNYWEGLENIHSEYVKGIKYYYNGVEKASITPPHAQGMHDMN